jgi:plasmid maintenance system antidote protein VapI
MPASNLNSIITCKRKITAKIDIKLEGAFGTPANI